MFKRFVNVSFSPHLSKVWWAVLRIRRISGVLFSAGEQRNTGEQHNITGEKLTKEKFTENLTDAEINPLMNYTIKLLNLVFAERYKRRDIYKLRILQTPIGMKKQKSTVLQNGNN